MKIRHSLPAEPERFLKGELADAVVRVEIVVEDTAGMFDLTEVINAIGTGLTFVFLVMSTSSRRKQRAGLRIILSRTFRAYYDSAIFVAFAVQLASVVTLVKVNFGLSANGMGANNIQITWIVSLLTLLPLSYGVFIFRTQDQVLIENGGPERPIEGEEKRKKKEDKAKSKYSHLFLLFIVAWMPSAYPFISRMVCTSVGCKPTQLKSQPNVSIRIK